MSLADAVQLDCKFKVGDRVNDECFGPGVVIELPLETFPPNDNRLGKIFIKYDDATQEQLWRTWGHFEVPERQAPTREAVTHTTRERVMPPPTQPPTQPPARQGENAEAPNAKKSKTGDAQIQNFFRAGPPSTGASTCANASGAGAASGLSGSIAGCSASVSAQQPILPMSIIERERAIKLKPAAASRGPAQLMAKAKSSKATGVLLRLILAEHPSSALQAVGDNLWCSACKCNVNLAKKFYVTQHLSTDKHNAACAKLARRSVSDVAVKEDIHDFFLQHPEATGSTVPIAEQHFHLSIVESLMFAGIPLSKADFLRPLLTRCGFASTDSSHLSTFVQLVEKREIQRICEDIRYQMICIAYDGTRRMGEAINVVGSFCSADFKIVMWVLAFITAAK